MRVAVVSSVPLFPTTEGNRSRVLNLVRALAVLGHEVHFVLLPIPLRAGVDIDLHNAEPSIARFAHLKRTLPGTARHWIKRGSAQALRRALRAIGHGRQFYNFLDEYLYSGSLEQLVALAAAERFDAVLVEYVFSSLAFSAFPSDVLKVLDTHDSFADRHLPFGPGATTSQYWYSIPPAEELRALRRADVAIAIQDEEAARFRERLGDHGPRVVTVSHTLGLDERVEDYTPPGATFVGSRATPNVAGMTFFLESVLPRVLEQMPDFRLTVAGGICDLLPDHPSLDKLGRVDSLIEAFRRAPLAINPVGIGTGINIKLLEAMANGVATVSTRTGMRGLGPEFMDGVVVVPDEDAQAFADALLALCRDPARRRELGMRARACGEAWNDLQLTGLREIFGEPAEDRRVAVGP